MSWLDAQADGIAFMLCVFLMLLVGLLIALAYEAMQSAGMRRRARQREAYRRYVQSIIDQCFWKQTP